MTDITNFGSPSRRVRIARLFAMFAASLAAVTCDLVTAPKAGSGTAFAFTYNGSRKIVVGSPVPVELAVAENGVNLEGARLQITTSNPNVIDVTGDDFNHTLNPLARGSVLLTVKLLGSSLGDVPPSDTFTVTAVAANLVGTRTTATMRSLGDTLTFAAKVFAANNTELTADGSAVRWFSSDPTVVAVDSLTGKATALKNGAASMIGVLRIDAETTTAAVTVLQQVAHYTFSPAPVIIGALGSTAQITPTARDSGGSPVTGQTLPAITYVSRRPSSISVNGTGLVTGNLNDSTYVVATSSVAGTTVTDSVRVEVGQVAQQVIISQSGPIAKDAVNDTVNITAVALDARGVAVIGRPILFTSRNSNVARQTATTASGATFALDRTGSAVVAAQLDGAKDSITVNVTNAPQAIHSTVAISMPTIGDSVTLVDSVFNRLGAYMPSVPVSWRALDTTIATVHPSQGVVVGRGIGRTSVIGTIANGAADTTTVDVANLIAFVDVTQPDTSLGSIGDTVTVRVDFRNGRGAQVPRSSAVWRSTDSTVVSVSNGFLTALRQGLAAIYATDPLNPARTDSVRITVTNAPALLTLNRFDDTLTAPSRTLQYVADVRNARSALVSNALVTFRTTNGSVASVTAGGLATALAVGTTKIIAEAGSGAGLVADTADLLVTNDAVGLSVSPTDVTIASVGATTQLVADARNAVGGAVTGVSFTWTSSDNAIASVSNTGVVTGVAVGQATITAKLAALTATANITVTNAPDTIQIAPTSITLASVSDSALPATRLVNALGSTLPRSSAQWLSDDGAVAQVTSNGIVIANGRGTTQIRARNPINISRQDSVTIVVTDAPDSINVVRTSDVLPSLNRTIQYTADVFNARRNALLTEPVTWTARNPTVATVSSSGLATSVGIGSTYIVGTAGIAGIGAGIIADSALLTVTNTAASVGVSPTSVNFTALNQTQLITVTARNELGNVIGSPVIAWGTTNGAVATVSPLGLITAVGVGSASVTATVDGITATIPVTVNNAPTTVQITSGTVTLASIGDQATPSVNFTNSLGTQLARDAVTWTSSNPAIFTVSSTGVVTAVTAGSATLTATSPANVAVTSSVTVTVTNAPATLTISPAGPSTLTFVGGTLNLAATVKNAANAVIAVPNPSVTWSSNNASVSVNATTGVATAVSPGSATITATAGAATNTVTINVTPAASATQSTISTSAATLTANGTSQATITVRLKDAGGTNLAGSGGTVTMTLTGTGTLSSVTNNLNGTYTATLTAPASLGSGSISAAINGASITTGDPAISYVAGPAAAYILTSSTATPVAGGNVTITAQLVDANNNPVTTARTVTWSSTGGGSFGSPTSPTNGSGIATVTFTASSTSGTSHIVTATDNASTTGSSAIISTIPGTGTKYLVTTSTASPTSASDVIVTAQLADANNNPVLVSGRTVTWSKSGAGGSFSAGTSNTNAAGVATITFTVGTLSGTVHTVTATDNTALTGTSGNLTVQPGALAHFLVEAAGGGAIGTQAAGTPFNVRVTAQDASNNTVTGYTGTVLLTSTGTLTGSPVTSAAFVNGVLASQALTLTNTGSFTVTATKSVTGETGSSSAFTTTSGALDHFVVEAAGGGAIATQSAGNAFNIRITAQDVNNNTVTSFATTATLTSTGTLTGAPLTSSAFTAGVLASQAVTITNGGSFTITATNSGKTGTSAAFTVGGGTAAKYLVTSSNFAPQAGQSVTITAQLADASNNAVLQAGQTVVWSQVNNPSNKPGTFATASSVTNSSGIAQVVFTTNASSNVTHSITATDNLALTGTAANIVTGAGAATQLVFTTQPSTPQIVGTGFGLVVTAEDANNNTSTGFNGNVTLTITGGTGTVGATLGGTVTVAAVNGVATFSGLTIDKAGTNYTLTASINAGAITKASSAFTVNNPNPTLTSLSPAAGDRLQTLDVVFTGTGFVTGVTTVSVGTNITVNSVTVNSTTQLTANITIANNAATGARNFTVTNPTPGGGTSGAQSFTVNNPLPSLVSIAPTTANRLQTLNLVFTGTGYITGVSSVNVPAGVTLNTTTVNSATQITANVTIGSTTATGAVNFSVTNAAPGGGTSATQSVTISNPAPTLTSAAPTSAVQGQAGLDVVLTGTNFISGVSSVSFSNAGVTVNTTTVNSATQITANITVAAGATTGAGTVSVTNAAPGGGTSATQAFTINAPATPTLTSLGTTSANVLSTLNVTFTGTGFVNGVSSVNVGSGITVNTTTVNSATQITANITITAAAATGARSFSVTNTPAGGTSGNQTFTVNNPAPTLASLGTTSATRLQTLDVGFTGTNFIQGTSTVNVGTNITVNSVTVNSSTSLTANLTIGSTAATGARNFSVTNGTPGGGTSGNQSFTINNPSPTVTNASPNTGVQGQTNLDVVLTGTNFISGSSAVSFANAGITVNTTTVNSGTQITVNISIAAGATTGAGDITVTNSAPGGGSGSLTNGFSVNAPAVPTLTSLSPTAGNRLQTLDVVFTGTGFVSGVSTVNVGSNITVNSTTVNSPTQITANLTIGAAAATGTRTFTVTNTPNGGTSGTQNFDVNNPAPTLTSASPNAAVQGQTSLDVVLTGTNFVNGVSSVSFSSTDITVNSTTVNSATQITANITVSGTATTGAGTVSVTNAAPGGGTSATQPFTLNAPAVPTLSAISPTSGTLGQTFDVTFTGTGFANGVSSVNVGTGITVNSTTVNSATQITANISISGATTAGARSFSVTNTPAGGTSGNQTFTVNNPAPTLTSISPTTANRLQTGVSLVLTGTDFITGVSSVNVPTGVTLNSTTVDNATQITINVDFGATVATGAVNFSVTNATPGGGTSATQSVTVSNPSPTFTAMSTTSGNRLQSFTGVTFTGTGFISGVTTVNAPSGVNVTNVSVTNSTTLTADVAITAAAGTGSQNFSVSNSTPGGGTSGTQSFTISNPAPTFTNVSPGTAVQGQQGLDVALTGTNFIQGVTAASFANAGITVNSTTVNSSTSATANISVAAGAVTTAGDVTVTNATPGGGTATLPLAFTVGAPASPTLTSLGTTVGNRLQTLNVVFNGTGFVNGVTTVNVPAGFTVNTTTINSTTQLTANITITGTAPTGANNFSVTNTPAGGTSANQTFTVSNPAPTLASVSPTTSTEPSTGEVLTLTGTGFISGVSTVNISSTQGLSSIVVAVVNSTTITVTLNLASNTTHNTRTISVTNPTPGGGTSSTVNWTIQ